MANDNDSNLSSPIPIPSRLMLFKNQAAIYEALGTTVAIILFLFILHIIANLKYLNWKGMPD